MMSLGRCHGRVLTPTTRRFAVADIELTEDDFALIRARTAKAAFTAAVALALQELAICPADEAPQAFFLKALRQNMKRAGNPLARYPMPPQEREKLRQYYRLFLGAYRDPHLLANLPSTSTKQ